MSVGKTLQRAVLGMAAGYGKHLQETGAAQAQAARDKVLMDREVALKALDHGYRMKEGDAAGERAIKLAETQGTINRSNTAAEIEGRTAGQIAVLGAEHVKKLELKKLDFDHDRTMEGVRSANRVKEAKANGQIEAELKRLDSDLASGDVKEVFAGGDGMMYARTDAGIKPLNLKAPATKTGSGGSILEVAGATETATAAAPTGDGATGKRAQALADLATRYASATPETAPGLFRNGKKISLAEAKGMIEARFPN